MKEETKVKLRNMFYAWLFASAILASFSLGRFTWLTAFVYKNNIRGYVPPGLGTLILEVFFSWILLIYFFFLGQRQSTFSIFKGSQNNYTSAYLIGWLPCIPSAFIFTYLYSSVAIMIFGYTLKKDIVLSGIGTGMFFVIAIASLMRLHKKSDNQRVDLTVKTPVESGKAQGTAGHP